MKIHLSRFWKRFGRRLALSAIALMLCFTMSVQQTRADVAFFEWLADTRVAISPGLLARAAGDPGTLTPGQRIEQTKKGNDFSRRTWHYEPENRRIRRVQMWQTYGEFQPGWEQPTQIPGETLAEITGWDANDHRIAHAHSDKLVDSDLPINFTAYDYDGSQLIMERKWDVHVACYAYGPLGPIARTGLMNPGNPCPRWLLSDGRGTTSGSADNAGNVQIQHFDAFGVALETATISTCSMPQCDTCQRGRRATGELGYHGQEGYKTRHYDANREADLPNKATDHPEYNAAYPEGYETASTGFMQVGARDYDPTIGRWLEVDPQSAGPELQYGQLNRWAYCANDPVNASDPTGQYLQFFFGLAMAIGGGIGAYLGFQWGSGGSVRALRAAIGAIMGLLLKLMSDTVSSECYGTENPWVANITKLLGALGLGAESVALIDAAIALGTLGVVMLGGFVVGLAFGMALGAIGGAVYSMVSATPPRVHRKGAEISTPALVEYAYCVRPSMYTLANASDTPTHQLIPIGAMA